MRRRVIERAADCCEYCLIHQDLAASIHQVDHVIAEKHGGETKPDNLALSRMLCNRRKASDIGSILIPVIWSPCSIRAPKDGQIISSSMVRA